MKNVYIAARLKLLQFNKTLIIIAITIKCFHSYIILDVYYRNWGAGGRAQIETGHTSNCSHYYSVRQCKNILVVHV